jgi:hypothetical protein
VGSEGLRENEEGKFEEGEGGKEKSLRVGPKE